MLAIGRREGQRVSGFLRVTACDTQIPGGRGRASGRGNLCAPKTVSSSLFHAPCMQLPELNSRRRADAPSTPTPLASFMCPQHPALIPSGTLCLGSLRWNALPPEPGWTDSISHFGLSSNVRSPLTPVSGSRDAAAQGPNPADHLILYQAWILHV